MIRPHLGVRRRHGASAPEHSRRTGRPPAVTAAAVVALVAAGLTAAPTAGAEPVPDPAVVPVGAGSYASAPPAALDTTNHDVSGFVDRDLYLDDSLAGKPVKTNAWWTDLLVSKFSGDLWANPLVVSNSAEGTRVTLPTRWNADGTARVLESPIVVGATASPRPGPSDVVMADFESGHPAGWTATGTAFSGGPSGGTATGQSAVSGFLGKRLVNSFTSAQGDGATGTLTSSSFTIDRNHLAFLIGGGNHPGTEEVRLVVDGQAVRQATGKNSEQLEWVTWDVAALRGRTARLEVVDTLTAGWAHVLLDQVVRTDDPAGLPGRFATTFAAQDATVTGWGEWDVSWRLRGPADTAASPQGIDVTAARGVPYVWFELDGVQPRLTIADDAEVLARDGAPLALPADVSMLRIRQNGRSYGVHLPDGSRVERSGNALLVTARAPYLVVSAIPQGSTDPGADLAELHQRAFAVVRDTRMDHAYDVAAGEVRQTWDLTTEALQGTNLDTVQGWLPHHYREGRQTWAFTGDTWDTPRGVLRATAGHGGWTLRYPFEGIVPFLPDPEGTPGYDRARMVRYVEEYAEKTGYGADTYWGGKDVLQLAQYMAVAKEIGADAAHTALKASLRTALNDWFTYTPGETQHFFARYPTWKALVGFSDSYGSFEFTDNHFHYGYFTLAAAYLALEDPEWGRQYGGLTTLVAKQYANWDRTDGEFPYLRTFDTWQGHSYAGGTSSPGGNNQESSSEALQSWAGLFLLGSALGNDAMRDAGAMGYVTERAAVKEYWFDYHGRAGAPAAEGPGNFPSSYRHGSTGILFDSGQAYATYFSGDPAWIYGIQWLPTGPWLSWFGEDQAFGKELLARMFDERTVDGAYDVRGFDPADPADVRAAADVYSKMGDALGNVVLGYLAQVDPRAYTVISAELEARGDPVARGVSMAGMVHYTGLANRGLGQHTTARRVGAPTSQVYRDGNVYTYVVYNPTDTARTYPVYEGAREVGTVSVPARQLVKVRSDGSGEPGTGEAELARGKTATASSVRDAQLPGLAVDGNPGSRWESQLADGQWLQVDLGARSTLTRVEIDWETAAAATFSVQVADSPTGPWTTLRTVTKTTAAPDVVTVSGTGRYLRIDAPKRLTPWGVSIWELRAYGRAA
ncbi:glycosyl hydrolase [Myceligenerans crystallogenes]|uniref:glucan endo-1,3-beta-D-glucosidase n=1 Tax=Myceligenerans crystallogenes TaxID=316335 RepID=A0ABN2NCZ2_9MICO